MLAQGFPGTNSKRWTQYVNGPTPTHTHGYGLGCYLHDAWGNRYLDFPSALGSLILGYSNTRVIEAVQKQAFRGCSFTLPTTLEVEVAEHLRALVPVAERIRFLKTGSEACAAAVRIARAATGRPIVLSQGYHGHNDLFTSLTDPALGVQDQFFIRSLRFYEDPYEYVKEHSDLDPKQIACLIVEALYLEMSDDWANYLRLLRRFCTEHGIVLIFDEIITGFRVPDWTVSKMYSVEPDLICMGKAIANGYPLALVGGKKELMDACEYFISSTFSGDAISLAACLATIREIELRYQFKDLLFYGRRLQDRLNMLHPEIRFEGYGTRAMLNATNPTTALFMQEMMKAGILFGKAHFFHFGHLEANIEEYVIAVGKGVIHQMQDGKVKLEGIAPQETFKR